MVKTVGNLLAILVLFGIVSGVILYVGNPGRMKRLNITSKYEFFLYSITAGIASMFGEMGMVADSTTRTMMGFLVFFVTMMFAFSFVLIAQAKMTLHKPHWP